MPSSTLLGQAILAGLFVGGLYALLGLGSSLVWGLLRRINLAFFGLSFLAAYGVYQLSTWHISPLLGILIVLPIIVGVGVAMHEGLTRLGVTEFTSLLVGFGLLIIIEAGIQWIWTADFRRVETPYGTATVKAGPLFISVAESCVLLVAIAVCTAVWTWLRFTYVGKALRAGAEDPAIAAAYGVDPRKLSLVLAGVSAGCAAIGGSALAIIHTLAPVQIYAWLGVVFAVMILGGIGKPLGLLVASVVVGVAESITMAVAGPTWAPLVAFTILILILLFQPSRV
jgi:branched-chain amino acid transport system permease protein